MVLNKKRLDNSGYLAIELESLHTTVRRILDGDRKAFNYFYGAYEVVGKISRSQLAIIVLQDHIGIYKTEITRPTCKTKIIHK